MTYNPAIPQSTDLISASQLPILTNFDQLNAQFFVEHTPFYTGSGNGDGLHKKATMPDTLSVLPAVGYGTYYASKTGSVPGNITEAVYKSGDSPSISILSAVKAWGVFNSSGTIIDGFNFQAVSNPGTGRYVVGFTNSLPNANYAVFSSTQMNNSFAGGGIAGFDVLTTGGFEINVRGLTGAFGVSVTPICFMVLQS